MITKIECYYRAVVDCWRLFKKYRAPQQSEVFWLDLCEDARKVYKQNQETIFVKELLLVVLDEIDRIWDKVRRDGR